MVVENELISQGLNVQNVNLGEVTIEEELDINEKNKIKESLLKYGFELIDDKKSRSIEKIKTLIIDLVHNSNAPLKYNLSQLISNELNQDYNYLSNLFSEVEGTTIEQYYINQKIEKVKELIVYDELSLAEIADNLNYSSASHLSKQFKKVTGLSPSHYKQLKEKKRIPLEDL